MYRAIIKYTELSPQKIARRRTLELARDGYTNLTVPKTIEPKVSRWFRNSRTGEYEFATLLLKETLKREQDTRHCIAFKIDHDVKLAQQRVLREELGGACMAMKKVLKDQSEYIHILRRIVAIKALRYNLENGLIQGKRVSSNLEAILFTPRHTDKPRVSSFDELLGELENGNFFPILNTCTGKITFTKCFEEILKLHDDDNDDACVSSTDNKTITKEIGPSSGLLEKRISATSITSSSCDSSMDSFELRLVDVGFL